MVDVFEQTDADHYILLGTISAAGPAKTGRLVPQLGRYYAAKTQTGTSNAAIQGFEILNVTLAKQPAAEESIAVHAPYAPQLEMETLSAHPDLRKMGLHAVPPGAKDSVIIANANVSRIG